MPMYKTRIWDFPDGPMAKNPPCNAGDTGSIPGQGRFHKPQGNRMHAPRLEIPCAATEDSAQLNKDPECHN